MYIIESMFIFVFGLVIGSFLNVCIYRIPRGESIVFPPSHCTNCNNKLKAMDLIPVFSYVLLKGKCRYCKEKIKPTYIIIELMTAIALWILYSKYEITMYFIIYSLLTVLLIIISKIDIDTFEVHLKLSVIGFVFGLQAFIYNLYRGKNFIDLGISILIPLVFIGTLILVTKEQAIGLGDLEIYLMVSLYFDYKEIIFILLVSFVVGGIYAVIKLILKKSEIKDRIAFVPYIGVATFVASICGEKIINSYLSVLYM